MIGKATKPYRSTLVGSIGAGMGSVFTPNSRKYYILEHKVTSKYHRAGESQEIIVDQIEIGRDSRCQVRFDDRFSTVSRHHAAIVKDGDNWKLIQISKTNTTLLNGHPVKTEWYLQNGDEIQLSVNGPKLGFIIPTGKKSTVGSIALTRRLSLFRQQALRPYKRAIAGLATVLVLLSAVGGYFLYESMEENKRLAMVVEQQKKQMEENEKRNKEVIDSVKNNSQELANELAEFKKKLPKAGKGSGGRSSRGPSYQNIPHVQNPSPRNERDGKKEKDEDKIDNNKINACIKDVYFIINIQFDIVLPDGSAGTLTRGEEGFPGWSGTGFLLNNGVFVTARHVIEGWNFWADGSGTNKSLLALNIIANNGGKVVCHYLAISSSGAKIPFTSEQFTINQSTDQSGRTDEGQAISLAQINNTDYAYARCSQKGNLTYDASLSNNLERGRKLMILGFPLALGGSVNPSQVSPKYSEAVCADNGLSGGVIMTTATTFEQGNSGGPAFCFDRNGNPVVIGIVSAGAGRSTGFLVPISQVR